ncbi:BatD family protein [Methanosarcina horonobensis]|uniref:BatD family protein n=1 Tax=Methanosarcina horonobensis TaxID=418008 RepID=UPI000AB7EBCE|nr:BatD family protein [Methanosarcina horonobensis]
MGEPVYVTVTARNRGICNINDIVLKDSIISNMHLQQDTTLDKTFSLVSGETAEDVFKYTLIPEKPGEFTFPAITATFTLLTEMMEA